MTYVGNLYSYIWFLFSTIFSIVLVNDSFSSIDVNIVDQIMSKTHVPLYQLFYLYVLELTYLRQSFRLHNMTQWQSKKMG